MKKVGKTARPFRYGLNQIPYDYTVEVRNRFKGLDLIDRVPDELWNEVHDIVQETGIKTIPMEKKCKKAKWLSGEALQIAVKRREAKNKGEKERYKHHHIHKLPHHVLFPHGTPPPPLSFLTTAWTSHVLGRKEAASLSYLPPGGPDTGVRGCWALGSR